MRKLILIKHARPAIDPSIPARDWQLSEEGRSASLALGDQLRKHAPFDIVTSDEPKAERTGSIVGDLLGVPSRTSPGLHEHDRSNVPHLPTQEFISLMALFFKERSRTVLGRESADESITRFSSAVETVMGRGTSSTAIVAHGTVISLFAAASCAMQPFQLWRAMQLPSYLVVEWPSLKLIELATSLGSPGNVR